MTGHGNPISWVLYLWIFLILWKATCVASDNNRANKASASSQVHAETSARHKRHAEVPVEDPSNGGQTEADKLTKQEMRNKRMLRHILSDINEKVGPELNRITNIPTTPAPLDGTSDASIPRPLDTVQDARTTSKVRKPRPEKLKEEGTTPVVTTPVVTTAPSNETATDVNETAPATNKGEIKADEPIKAKIKKPTAEKNEEEQSITEAPTQQDKGSNPKGSLKYVKEKASHSLNDAKVTADGTMQVLSYDEFLEKAAKKKNYQDKTLRLEKAQTQDEAVQVALDSQAEALKLRHHQSLILLQNASKEAESIQKRLKTHKLKLKSYIDELKNFTQSVLKENKKEKMKNYTKNVLDKVSDIVNPKKQEHELGAPDVKPRFFSKDITETLRARVDMLALKKSESFWDKKGEDIDDPHLKKIEKHLEEMQEEDELDTAALVDEYTEDDPPLDQTDLATEEAEETSGDSPDDPTPLPERADEEPHDLTEEHLNDYHQTRLNEIHVNPDKNHTKTNHESLLMSQMISARIHGNVLAPPPERCSVTSNMRRYRPPEESMIEDESTLYRANIQPEIDNAIEGAPLDYLKDYKNPCWLSRITDGKGTLWYDYTETGLTYKRMSFLYEMRLSKDSNWRMRCLPYLYLIGVTKSGTTDLYTRMLGHPEILRPGHKEPMWWNRLTLGMAESLRKPFRYYVDFFDEAAELIRRKVILKDGKPYHPGITMDATPANLWDYDCWTDIPGNRGLSEPKYTLAHSIRKLVPNAKILMVLREPTSRLYSQYRMKSHMEPSTTFHKHVMEAIVNFNHCLEKRTLRSCAYDYEISKHEFQSPGGVFIRASLYYVFVKDWLEVFPRDQVKIVRTEDYHNNTEATLDNIFKFLDLTPIPEERLHAITKQRTVNTRADHFDRSMEPMLPETQRLLNDFFAPYNKLLAKLLKDKRYKWNDIKTFDYDRWGE